MKWKYAGVLLLLFIAQLAGIASPAQAVSIYDDKILTTDSLEVLSVEGTTNLTADWQQVFLNVLQRRSGDANADEMLSQFESNRTAGSGWLVQAAYQGMRVITFDPAATVSFDNNWYGYLHLSFSTGRVCVWESGGHTWKDWRNLDATPKLESYVTVTCSSHSAIQPPYIQYDIGLPSQEFPYLFIKSSNLQYPTGYEGDLVPTTEPKARYVALGDSFSSGEGNPPFEYGTDQGGTNENRCHRSSKAYPRLLQNDPSLDLGSTAFVACSGATTASVLYGGSGAGNWNKGPQVAVLSSEVEVVTLTVGGNDVGFGDYVLGCVVAPCGPSSIGGAFYYAVMANIESLAFLDNLKTTYETILDEAPNAHVYVMDYPYLVDPTGVDSPGCVLGVDMTGALGIQQALNAVIADAVGDVQALSSDYLARLHYMPTNYIGSPFFDHHLCTDATGGAYFNALDPLNQEHSFHPNANGQEAYYQIMEDYLS
ncbi:MAG TPA: SGNH/GDSL hydrolase family protein [Candidatus Saccharimonadales bacterium]